MTSVPVFVESWQHECCGKPFAVGSRVAWRLAADEPTPLLAALGSHRPPWTQTLPVVKRLEAADGDHIGALVAGGGLRVFARGATSSVEGEDSAGGVLVHGPLVEDHHIGVPPEVDPVRGVVRRVRTVRVAYERDAASGSRVPAPGSARLADVAETERWNSDEDGRRFIGFLVELEVDG